ncbi:hypothetical protein EJ110_NYTH21193 [Nymphaea thermarum]|nr:hypothetical protein EJ110_NYTH21193 [Nymphaea thermarum]
MESNKPSDASELLGDTVDQIFSNHNERKFCGRGHKSWGRNQSLTKGHGSQNSTQIIVLKPGLPNINVSLSLSTSPQSHFKEFKRKLKHATLDAKAEQHHVSMDGIPHRFFHGYQGFKEPRDPATTGEFQKLLSENINVTDADEPFSSRPPTTTLERLLSLPESNRSLQSEDIAVSSPCIPSDCEASNPSVLSENVYVPIKPRKIHFEEVEYSQRMEALSDRDGMLATASLSRMATGSCIQLKGMDYEYVRMLLKASNLTADMELDPCWDSINQTLHPSIFLLVDPTAEVSVDQLLLFDCVNEVLLETLERSFGFCELVSFSRLNIRPFPIGERLLEEVRAGLNSRLAIHSNESPTLDHIVGVMHVPLPNTQGVSSGVAKISLIHIEMD